MHSIYLKIAFALNDMAIGIGLFYKTLIYGYPHARLSTAGLGRRSAVCFVIDFNTANVRNLTVRQYSVVGVATKGWTVRGSNPGAVEIFKTRSDRPWDPPSLLLNVYRLFPGGKATRGLR
jgi:hypothetical protein